MKTYKAELIYDYNLRLTGRKQVLKELERKAKITPICVENDNAFIHYHIDTVKAQIGIYIKIIEDLENLHIN